MQLEPMFFSIVGVASAYTKDAQGDPLTGFDLGEIEDFTFDVNTSATDYASNRNAQRQTVLTLEQGIVTGAKWKQTQLNNRLFEKLYRGKTVAQAEDAVADLVITGTALAVGDYFQLRALNVGSVVIKDSTAGTPKTLTRDVNYELDDATGVGRILNLTTGGAFVGPLKGSFTPGAANYVSLLTASKEEFWLTLAGENTAIPGFPRGVMDLYKVQFEIPSSTPLINKQRGEMPTQCKILGEYLKPATGPLGQTGRISGFGFVS